MRASRKTCHNNVDSTERVVNSFQKIEVRGEGLVVNFHDAYFLITSVSLAANGKYGLSVLPVTYAAKERDMARCNRSAAIELINRLMNSSLNLSAAQLMFGVPLKGRYGHYLS